MSAQPLLQISSFKRVSPKLHSDDQYTTIYAAGFYLRDSDMILVKTTEHGSEEWTQTFEIEEGSEDSGYDVLQTADECYVLIGTTSNELGSDAYVIKTCEDGTQPVSFFSPHSSERKLEKVVDVMGREVNPVPNQILFFIDTDGSVEQKCIWN